MAQHASALPSMNKTLLCGLAVLGGAWLGPLPALARQLFVAHTPGPAQ